MKCHFYSGFFDKQHEYFDSEYHHLEFVNRNPNRTNYFQFSLRIDAADKLGKPIFFDRFDTYYTNSGAIYLVSARETPLSSQFRDSVNLRNFKFVADTVMLGRTLKNVYYSTNTYNQNTLYFQKSKMILGYREAGKTWLLNRIK